jgi:hypothetical protein
MTDIAYDAAYAVNQPRIISENIDGEVVMIDLVTGSYYSLNATGAEIWACFEGPRTLSQITTAISSRYDRDQADRVEAAVRGFIGELETAELIVAANGATAAETNEAVWSGNGAASPYERPELTVYRDMQDLLLLDPVHEVDDGGWPYALPKEPTRDDAATNTG